MLLKSGIRYSITIHRFQIRKVNLSAATDRLVRVRKVTIAAVTVDMAYVPGPNCQKVGHATDQTAIATAIDHLA